MKFGICTKLDNCAIAKAAGADYIEPPVTSLVPEEDDAAFAPILKSYQASPLSTPVFNIFLPGDLKVTGQDVDFERATAYVHSALPRAKATGAQTIVFGSGRSRRVPDGFSHDAAFNQLVDFLRMVADVADQTGITIAIEPLRRAESNIINTVADGVELARRVDRPSIRVLADFYHMDEESEPLDHLSQYAEWLAHIHVADTDRGAPGTGIYPYAEFVDELDQARYDGLISIECRWQDLAQEVKSAVDFLRTLF